MKAKLLTIILMVGFINLLSPLTQQAQAETLKEGLTRILVEHRLMKRVSTEAKALEQQIGVEKANWFPTVSLDVANGIQDIYKESGTDTKLATTEFSIGFTQTVWDFGQTSGSIDRAEAVYAKKMLEVGLQTQNLLLAGIEAHLLLKKAAAEVEHASHSLQNIKQQARLEDARVKMGQGYNTDLLQAKGQLSLAQARLIDKKGAYQKAINRYKAVFGHNDFNIEDLQDLTLPEGLPANLEELLNLVNEKNPDLLQSRSLIRIADQEVALEKSKILGPTIELVADNSLDYRCSH
ncbi:MAG: TolC family protein [Magnetococcales bacterium]|nr:TolC family protein [Magnetococcales bacterium]